MLAGFPVIEIEGIMRRTVRSAILMGIVAMVAAFAFHQPLVAPGIAIGLVLAVLNHRVFQSSALRFISADGKVVRKPFAGSVALRLGICTAVALALLVVVQPMGWGVIGGLMMFQLLMMTNALVSLIRYQRQDLSQLGKPDA
ncbi:MAG: ATP synthase subunit I [Acidimicrobiales bacterium]